MAPKCESSDAGSSGAPERSREVFVTQGQVSGSPAAVTRPIRITHTPSPQHLAVSLSSSQGEGRVQDHEIL